MNELLARIVDAHGGWIVGMGTKRVDATIVSSGGFFPLKGMIQDPSPVACPCGYMKSVHRSSLTALPISAPCYRVHSTKDRYREARWHTGCRAPCSQGLVRRPSNEHAMGCAASCLFQWLRPVHLSHHTLSSGDGVAWGSRRPSSGRRARGCGALRAYFPGSIETHSLVQDFFFGEDLMLRCHDYSVNIAGGFGAAQLTSDYVEANGIRLPTKRRAYTRGPDRQPILEMLMVAIDISDVTFN